MEQYLVNFNKKLEKSFIKFIKGELSFPLRIPTGLYRQVASIESLKQDALKLKAFKDQYPHLIFEIEEKKYRKNFNTQSICKSIIISNEDEFLKTRDFRQRFQKLKQIQKVLSLDLTRAKSSSLVMLRDIEDKEVTFLKEILEMLVSKESLSHSLRELPHSGDGKYIEKNKTKLKTLYSLRADIDLDESKKIKKMHFEHFFGKTSKYLCTLKASDKFLSLSPYKLDRITLDSNNMLRLIENHYKTLFIIENKETFNNFPLKKKDMIALWGAGRFVLSLTELSKLSNINIYYYGDLDLEGLDILAGLRRNGIKANSINMDHETLVKHAKLCGPSTARENLKTNFTFLTDREISAYKYLSKYRLKLEQEKIPLDFDIPT